MGQSRNDRVAAAVGVAAGRMHLHQATGEPGNLAGNHRFRNGEPFRYFHEALLNKAPGGHPMQLIVTGAAGPVAMTWEEVGLFYAAELPRPEK